MRRLRWLAELAAEPPLPTGTRVFVEEDGYVYHRAGMARPDIAARLGWAARNVWLPEHVLTYILQTHRAILDPVRAAAATLDSPISAHEDRFNPDHHYFIAHGATLRASGLLASRSARYVDAVVELREVAEGQRLPRLFHLSLARRNKGGRQLWP